MKKQNIKLETLEKGLNLNSKVIEELRNSNLTIGDFKKRYNIK